VPAISCAKRGSAAAAASVAAASDGVAAASIASCAFAMAFVTTGSAAPRREASLVLEGFRGITKLRPEGGW
jgi:hypothetical protein